MHKYLPYNGSRVEKRGDFGRLGHGNSSDLFTPQPIKALHGLWIKQIACGDGHCLAVAMEGEVQRNIPKIIEALSVDGSTGQQIESSKVDPSSGKSWVSPSERYAVVPDETGQTIISVRGNGSDENVPESDVKRIWI